MRVCVGVCVVAFTRGSSDRWQGTTNRTALAIARETAAAGVTLSATAWRDYISYTATFLRDELPVAVNNLADAISGALTWRALSHDGGGVPGLCCHSEPSLCDIHSFGVIGTVRG